MRTFLETCRARGIRTLAVFGDSITVGAGAGSVETCWARRLADRLGADLINRGLSGTVLQSTPVHDGRGDSGVPRFRRDLLGPERADAIAILYGYNDARYTADPDRFNVAAFVRDYRVMLAELLMHYPADLIAIGSPPYPSDRGLEHGGPGFTGQSRAGFEAYRDAVRRLAAAYSLPYAAVYESMARAGDGVLASDDITHPNDAGHAVIFESFLQAGPPG